MLPLSTLCHVSEKVATLKRALILAPDLRLPAFQTRSVVYKQPNPWSCWSNPKELNWGELFLFCFVFLAVDVVFLLSPLLVDQIMSGLESD